MDKKYYYQNDALFLLPIDNFLFFSILLLNFFVRNFYISLCHALMRMIVSTTPRGLHGNGCHTEWRIKRTVLYTFSPCSSFWLTAFLTITLLYDRHPSLLLFILISNLTLCDLFFFSPITSVQNPCMEILLINHCLTVVPVERQSTESPSMGTGQRRFTPKTIPVSTIFQFFMSSHVLYILHELRNCH